MSTCLSKSVGRFVSENFNVKVAKELPLSGCATMILARFVFDKQGGATKIRVLAEYPELEKKAEKVISLFPRVNPATRNGKPVNALYSLPIIIFIK